jgi:hypothetical protein
LPNSFSHQRDETLLSRTELNVRRTSFLVRRSHTHSREKKGKKQAVMVLKHREQVKRLCWLDLKQLEEKNLPLFQ